MPPCAPLCLQHGKTALDYVRKMRRSDVTPLLEAAARTGLTLTPPPATANGITTLLLLVLLMLLWGVRCCVWGRQARRADRSLIRFSKVYCSGAVLVRKGWCGFSVQRRACSSCSSCATSEKSSSVAKSLI